MCRQQAVSDKLTNCRALNKMRVQRVQEDWIVMLNRTLSIPQQSHRLTSRRFRSHISPSGTCNINLTLTHAHQASRITLILKIHPQAPAQHPTHINLTSILHISNAQRPNRTTPSIHPPNPQKAPCPALTSSFTLLEKTLFSWPLAFCGLLASCSLQLTTYNLHHATLPRTESAMRLWGSWRYLGSRIWDWQVARWLSF